MTDRSAKRVRPTSRRFAAALAVAGAALVLLLALIAARRQIAREIVTDWLRSKGVASESRFESLGPGRLVGRIRIGSPAQPDLVVERAEIRYSLGGLLVGRGIEVTSIRLIRPVLSARWQGGRFSAGGLDPLIAEFRKRPPRPGAPSPGVEIDDGLLRLATDYGLLEVSGGAVVRDGRLTRLDAAAAPFVLRSGEIAADFGPANLQMRTADGRLTARLRVPIRRARLGQAHLEGGALRAQIQATYPDLSRDLAAAGQAVLELDTRSGAVGESTSGQMHLIAASSNLQWRRAAGDQVLGDLRLDADLRDVAAAQLRVASASASLRGGFSLGEDFSARLSGGVLARGGWNGLGRPTPSDSRGMAALKRNLRAFRVRASSLTLAYDRAGPQLSLTAPVQLVTDAGGAVQLEAARGGFFLTASGGGLPRLEAHAQRVVRTADGIAAVGRLRASAVSFAPVEDGAVDFVGELRVGRGLAAVLASRCATVSAARFELGQNDLRQLTGRFCPTRAPLLRLTPDGWRLTGRARDFAAEIPFLQANVAQAAGSVELAASSGGLSAKLTDLEARLSDAAPAPRFRPLRASGGASLMHNRLTGVGDVRLPDGPRIAHATLQHDVSTGAGGVAIDTGALVFSSGGLQPDQLSSMAAALGAAFEGSASFAGAFHWTKDAAESNGRLSIPRLDFRSPVGAVTNLSGEIELTSLAPFIAPPGQTLSIARVGGPLPLTDGVLHLALSPQALTLVGEAAGGGGRLRISQLTVPLEAAVPIRGVIEPEGVQLHDLVEASPFGDRVDLDARVSGRVPFDWQDGKLRITGGDLHAVAPGRLSIQRAALAEVSARGALEAPATAAGQIGTADTFTDFAYQGLEHLAYETLDATLATRADGRLGVLFHIVGRHDPPQHQEIRISLLDLIRRRFLGKKLPLPSDTGVDLTLDTSVNINELLADYAEFGRLRSSQSVQP